MHGYALMGNHYHLLVEVPRGNLSIAMRDLIGDFSLWLNRVHGWDGPVFKGRFQNRLVETDGYWTHLLAYLHCNPVRSGWVSDPAEAVWTSCKAYYGLVEAPEWLTTSELLAQHGGAKALASYTAEVAADRELGPPEFDPETWCSPTSTEVVGQARAARKASVDEAVAQVAAITGLEVVDLLRSGRRSEPETAVLAWWLSRSGGVTQSRQAQLMGVSPSAISYRVRRAERLRDRRPDCLEAGWMRELVATP